MSSTNRICSGLETIKDIAAKLSELPTDLDAAAIDSLLQEIEQARDDEERYQIYRKASQWDEVSDGKYSFCVNSVDLNNQRYLNRYLIRVNEHMEDGGVFICSFHCAEGRMMEIYENHSRFVAPIIFFFDFIWHRAIPKTVVLKKIYFKIYNKVKRVYPVAEVWGRLSYCGFRIKMLRRINGTLHVVVQKVGRPSTDTRPSYGFFISMPRVGKDKKIIHVHKIRTMYAYSEYLQDFTYELNDLSDGGKFADDFRVSGWGRILRKFFIDEIPMLYNVIKGDLKLVGVRPLTQQYFQLYTPEMQEYRTRHKPGMLPPYYVECPRTLEDIQANERRYLEAYEAHRLRTQWKYFWKILYNVIVKRKHSA